MNHTDWSRLFKAPITYTEGRHCAKCRVRLTMSRACPCGERCVAHCDCPSSRGESATVKA